MISPLAYIHPEAKIGENENTIDPKAYGKKAIQAVKELVEARM